MNPILLFQEPAPSSTLEEELNEDDVDNAATNCGPLSETTAEVSCGVSRPP
jgi:hypothetical protein